MAEQKKRLVYGVYHNIPGFKSFQNKSGIRIPGNGPTYVFAAQAAAEFS